MFYRHQKLPWAILLKIDSKFLDISSVEGKEDLKVLKEWVYRDRVKKEKEKKEEIWEREK